MRAILSAAMIASTLYTPSVLVLCIVELPVVGSVTEPLAEVSGFGAPFPSGIIEALSSAPSVPPVLLEVRAGGVSCECAWSVLVVTVVSRP